jgi:hypothetical protein
MKYEYIHNAKEKQERIEEMHKTTFCTTPVSSFESHIKYVKFVDNTKSHMFIAFMYINLCLR